MVVQLAKLYHYVTRGPWIPPIFPYRKGEVKRSKLSSSYPKSVESDRYNVDPIEMVVDDPGTEKGFSALSDRGYVN